jgi:hypothetical protein
VELVTIALFVTMPDLAPGATRTRNVNAATLGDGNVAAVQVTVPFVPTAGVVQVKPPGGPMNSNSRSAGSTSVSTTSVAALGPVFWIDSV